jgi:hypothetical protein
MWKVTFQYIRTPGRESIRVIIVLKNDINRKILHHAILSVCRFLCHIAEEAKCVGQKSVSFTQDLIRLKLNYLAVRKKIKMPSALHPVFLFDYWGVESMLGSLSTTATPSNLPRVIVRTEKLLG